MNRDDNYQRARREAFMSVLPLIESRLAEALRLFALEYGDTFNVIMAPDAPPVGSMSDEDKS